MASQATESQLISVVAAVEAFREAQKRIPSDLSRATYFGVNDWWIYMKSYHPNMCGQCDFYGEIKHFNGSHLRGDFPYLEISDENMIYANVHPHCTCVLLRLREPEFG